MFVQKCQVILNKGFVLLWTNSPRLHQAYSLESWLTGTVFKILDARQSEIHHQFTRNISLNFCKNIRNLFKRLKRFQILLWAWSRGNRRAFLTYFCRSPLYATGSSSPWHLRHAIVVLHRKLRALFCRVDKFHVVYKSEERLWRMSAKTTDSL